MVTRLLILSVLLIAIALEASSQESVERFQTPFDVFELDSVQHVVVAQGEGYFPILNVFDFEFLTVYRRGAGHWGRNGHLVMRQSSDGGFSWLPASTVVNSHQDDRNAAVGVTHEGRIVVGYLEQGSYNAEGRYDPTLGQQRCLVTSASILDEEWSAPRPLGIPGLESATPYGRIQQTFDGVLLMNVHGPYTRNVPGMRAIPDDAGRYAYLARSLDGGETWEDPSLIALGHSETALFVVSEDRLLAAARSEATGQINLFRSRDGGREWSSPLRLTDGMQHPADFVELSNGWLLLLYGDRSRDFQTVQGVISRDGGRSWDLRVYSVFSRPVLGDFGYPSGVRLPNGRIAIQYYWAGRARDKYDGSEARLYMTLFDEDEFIEAYMDRLAARTVEP